MATDTARPRKPRQRGGPPGRPSEIDRELHLPDGSTTTVGDRIIFLIGTVGTYAERAAASAGIGKGTLHGWLHRAARARELLALGQADKVTAHDRRCISFSDAVEQAEARWEMTSLAALERIATGTVQLTTTVDKYDADGNLVESTTKVTGLAPNPNVIMWRLVRKFPERYQIRHDPGAAAPVDGPGSVSGPIDLTSSSVAEMLNDIDEFTAGMATD